MIDVLLTEEADVEANPALVDMAAFVEEYESREAYHIEAERLHTYELYFEFFNVRNICL